MIDITLPSSLSLVALCPASLSDTRWQFLGPTHHQTLSMCFWVLFGEFLTDSLGIKAAGVFSRVCSTLTDLQLASSTPASASSLSRVSPQPVSPAHRLPSYRDSCLSSSLCVVPADYKLAKQISPELYNTGTELKQRSRQYRSQISH